jgi:hypothetical protein
MNLEQWKADRRKKVRYICRRIRGEETRIYLCDSDNEPPLSYADLK